MVSQTDIWKEFPGHRTEKGDPRKESPELGDAAGRLRDPRQLQFTEPSVSENRPVQRDNYRYLQMVPLESLAEYRLVLRCEETSRDRRKTHQKRAGETTPKAHTELGIVCNNQSGET